MEPSHFSWTRGYSDNDCITSQPILQGGMVTSLRFAQWEVKTSNACNFLMTLQWKGVASPSPSADWNPDRVFIGHSSSQSINREEVCIPGNLGSKGHRQSYLPRMTSCKISFFFLTPKGLWKQISHTSSGQRGWGLWTRIWKGVQGLKVELKKGVK